MNAAIHRRQGWPRCREIDDAKGVVGLRIPRGRGDAGLTSRFDNSFHGRNPQILREKRCRLGMGGGAARRPPERVCRVWTLDGRPVLFALVLGVDSGHFNLVLIAIATVVCVGATAMCGLVHVFRGET